jgi:hypothetical protein
MSSADIEDERQRKLLAYWRSKAAADGGLPVRSDVDPLEMGPELLPHVMIAELVPPGAEGNARAGARWRYRLVGTSVVAAAHRDPTGRFLDEILPGAYGDYVLGLYATLHRHARPLFAESSYAPPAQPMAPERKTRRLMLPLAAERGGAVRFVLSAQVFVSLTRADMRGILEDAPFAVGRTAFVAV